MTATELVTQIETMHGILAYNGSQVVCACDRTWKPAEDYAAHIARAVLAALTEAGTVEWGMQSKTFIDGDWDRVWTKDPDSGKPFTERKARNHLWLKSPIPFRLVSRLALPWERAE